jgi:hypothetical protein
VTELRITIRGDREVLRALDRLPNDARREFEQGVDATADGLAQIVTAAGRADTRQSARAADTVRPEGGGLTPRIVAGPHALLFGSEFGAWRRFGWYSWALFRDSPARQFRPHLGQGSYWFFRAQEDAGPWVDEQWRRTLDAAVSTWSA